MAVYLVSREPAGREIAHSDGSSAGAFLCTKEFADQYSLMHYRRGGEKRGVRRWQNEDGSYTKAGYEHYAEMYGWGKFRADRAEKKAEKYRDKATKAEEKLNRQKLKTEEAQHKANLDQQKLDRYNKKHSTSASGAPIVPTPSKQSRAVDKDLDRLQKENNRLQEAQIKFDKLSNKAEKYQNKSDQIHYKWDKQTKKIEEKAQNYRTNESEERFWRQQTEVEGKLFGEAHGSYVDGEKRNASKAEKYEKELLRRGIEPKGSRIDENTPERKELARKANEKVIEEFDRLHKNGDITDAQYEKELRERGLTGHKEESKSDVTPAVARLLKNGQSVEDRDFRYTLYNGVNTIGFDSGSAEFRRDFGDLALYYLNNFDPNDRKSGATKLDKEGYNHVVRNVVDEIEACSGSESTGEYKPGSNGEKAHNALMESYNKSWARREELRKENSIDYEKGSKKERQREYDKLKKVLKSDKLYQALKENDKKSEDALMSAVLKDLGFSDTPANREALFPMVFFEKSSYFYTPD